MKLNKLLMLLAIFVVVVAGGIYVFFNGGLSKKSLDNLGRNERLALKTNIVVMGVDERADDVGRSDTLFVVMFDSKNDHVSLLSIPRDTMVKIPDHGWDKVNHAYGYGGYELTRDTVEELLGIQLNYYVVIDFKGFKRLVDAIGGIDIVVDKDMYYEDPWDNFVIDLQKGKQHLNGETAIQYVRYRDEEGDIGRIRRQQQFLSAVYDKFVSAQIITKMPGLVKEFTSMVKTNMSLSDLATMGKAMRNTMKEKGGLYAATVPGEPVFIDEISYWIPDMTDLRAQMVEMQGAEMSDKYRIAAEKVEAEYKKIVPDEDVVKTKDEKNKKEVKIVKKPTLEELMKSNMKTGKTVVGTSKEQQAEEVKTKLAAEENKNESSTQVEEVSAATPKGRNLSVSIINCSGREDVLERAVLMAQEVGLVVISTGAGEVTNVTQVVSMTSDGYVVSRLAALPFDYSLRIARDSDAGVDGVIYLGADFK